MSNTDRYHIELLDHGFLSEIEHWGSDERIIESARMSTGKGFKGWGPTIDPDKPCARCKGAGTVFSGYVGEERGQAYLPTTGTCPVCDGDGKLRVPGDEKLLRYLYEHKHSTPFEMAGLTIEVQAPIFVFRQWHRHRTQSYNEMSARYTPLPALDFRPEVERCIVVPGKNKQARGANQRVPTHEEVLDWLENYLDVAYGAAQRAYDRGLEIGIPKELSRLPVPVARYSLMRASANLRNWLAFLTLRMDPHAQEEIRVFADAVGAIIEQRFPRTWALFVEGRA